MSYQTMVDHMNPSFLDWLESMFHTNTKGFILFGIGIYFGFFFALLVFEWLRRKTNVKFFIRFTLCMFLFGVSTFAISYSILASHYVTGFPFQKKWEKDYFIPYVETLPTETYELVNVYSVDHLPKTNLDQTYAHVSFMYKKDGKYENLNEIVQITYEDVPSSTFSYKELPQDVGSFRKYEKGTKEKMKIVVQKGSPIWKRLFPK